MLRLQSHSGPLALAAALSCAAVIGGADAQPPVTLVQGSGQIALAGHVAELYDETGDLTLADVLEPAVAARFAVGERDVFTHGLSADTYWYRWHLRRPTDPGGPATWIVNLGIPTLDHLDVHVARSNGETETILTGDLRPGNPRLIPYLTFAIPLEIAPGEDVTIHVRLQTTGRHQFWPQLFPEPTFVQWVVRTSRASGIVNGIFLVTILYNLLLFFAIRDRAYLHYVFFLLTYFGAGLTYNGFFRQYGSDLAAGAPALINALGAIWPGVVSLSLLVFSAEFMQTRLHLPRCHRLLMALAAVAALSAMIYPVAGFLLTIRLAVPVLPATLVILLGVSIHLAARGIRAARYYLFAWAAVFAAMALFAAETVGILPTGVLMVWLPGATACIAVTLLSLALADRINTARREQFAAAERAERLKSFLPERVAELVGSGERALLEPRRRNVTVLVLDLRGFTPFAETAAPEDVMAVLHEFYGTMGAIVEKYGGTVEHFAGDSMLVFFNAPLELAEPERHGIECALDLRAAFEPLRATWLRRGYELGLGVGIANGFATTGAIGFSGRSQYAAIGAVTNLASRLCGAAGHGEILTTSRVLAAVDGKFESESAGEQAIRGFSRPVQVARVVGPRVAPAPPLVPAPQPR